jgi:calcineurin-like phosphoesterase family protein
MMRYWLLPDPHFLHENICQWSGRPKGFEQKLFTNWNINVDPNDVVLVLGDICLGKDEEVHELFVKPLVGKKILVRGNHDKKSDEWYMRHGWDFVCHELRLEKFGYNLVLSHEPVSVRVGEINGHGHFHNTDHRSQEPEYRKIRTPRTHRLLALEHHGYGPILLDTFVKKTMHDPKNFWKVEAPCYSLLPGEIEQFWPEPWRIDATKTK